MSTETKTRILAALCISFGIIFSFATIYQTTCKCKEILSYASAGMGTMIVLGLIALGAICMGVCVLPAAVYETKIYFKEEQ